MYISLPLLRFSRHSRFSMCLCILRRSMHSMYSRRLFKSILYHVFIQFSRRSIPTPIDSAQSMYSFSAPVYYLYTRAVLCTRSQLCSHLKICFTCFTPISLSSSFFAATRFIHVSPIAQGSAPPIQVNINCKHFASFHRCASRTWQCNIRINQIVCKKT